MARWLTAMAFASLALAGPAGAVEVVVIASGVPGIKVGQVVDSSQALDLAAGQKLTLVAGGGKSVTRAGPYKGPAWDTAPPAADKKFLDAVAALASGQGKGGTTLGAVRGGAKGEPADPWVVDVGRSGDQCVSAGAAATLWRAEGGRGGTLALQGLKDEGTARVAWSSGEATLGWPEAVRIVDGAVYLARLDASPSAKRIVIHVVPADLASAAHRAVWMASNGCQAQGRLLLWGLAGGE